VGREISTFEGLEPYDGKLSRPVLRGRRAVRPLATRSLMYTHKFEDRVFRQAAYWVHKLDIDIEGNRIFLELIANPETQEYEGVIKFCEIKDLEVQNFDEDSSDNYIASLLGILEHSKEVGTQYLVTTDLVEVSFITEIEPEVNWADPDKPKQEWKREKLKNSI
jgi:hypothetical protein